MKCMKKKKGYFSISAVSEVIGIHQQTIRMYERQGLISPKRSEGNTRLFSEEDIEKLEQIIYLTNKVGVNLAGVEMIIKMQKRIEKLQNDMKKQVDDLFEDSSKMLEEDKNNHFIQASNAKAELDNIKKKRKGIDKDEQ